MSNGSEIRQGVAVNAAERRVTCIRRRLLLVFCLAWIWSLGCGPVRAQSFVEMDLGFDPSTFISSLAIADVDDDGDLDIFLTGYLVRDGTNYPAMLGRNQGNGTFNWEPWIVPGEFLTPPTWVNSSASWVDYNHDGRLDSMVVANGQLYVYLTGGHGSAGRSCAFILGPRYG
jgi:hypothetical protein